MMKHFPTGLMSAAWLRFAASSSSRQFANAQTREQVDEAKGILEKMEDDVKAFRDKLEEVYKKRCDSQTYSSCIRKNYNDCSSAFPNKQCTYSKPQCGDSPTRCDGEGGCDSGFGVKSDSEVTTPDCNVLSGDTITKVSIPDSVAQSLSKVLIAKVVESACYSRLAEEYMVIKYKESEENMAKYNTQPLSFYFGGHDGLFRQVPALHQVQCGCYDPRRRPWFVAASSGRKNVVLVIDVSESMDDTKGNGRMRMAKEAADTIVDTLTAADSFAVIAFNTSAYQLGNTDLLIVANSANKERLKAEIYKLEPDGITNFRAAFMTAFDAIDKSLENEELTPGPIAILFMTDGKIGENMTPDEKEVETKEVIDLIKERTKQLSDKGKNVTIFTYSLGGEADRTVTKTIACDTGGIWTPVEDCGNLVGKMSSYYKLFALGNQNAVTWVDTYKFTSRGVNGTTVSVPVYDQEVDPPIFLGVAAVDIYLSPIQQILGLDEESAISWLNEWSKTRNFNKNAPSYEPLNDCQLDALRYLGSPESTCGVLCNITDYSGIVPEPCGLFENAPLDELWVNNDLEGKTYKEFQSEMCPDPTPEPSPPPPPPITAIIAGATVGGVFVVVVVCACILYQKKNSKPSSVMRRTNRSTTLEESATQPPLAVEPQGNQSSDPERNEEMHAHGIPVASKVDNFPHVIPVPVQWSPPPPSAPPLYPNE